MRDLVLFLAIPAALIYALCSASGAILVMLWIGFQRPYDFSWGFWKDQPVWQIAFVIALFSNLLRGQLRPKFPRELVLFLMLCAWIALSCPFAYSPEISWTFFSTYMVALVCGPILLCFAANDLEFVKKALWVSAGGLAFNAAKTGASLSLSGGGTLTDQITGFVGDNNVFGLTLCLVVAVLMGLRSTLPARRGVSAAFYGAVVLILLTIVYTKSRGALLTIGVIMLAAALLSERKVRNLVALCCVVLIGYLVIPESYFGRLETLQSAETISADESAMGRVENWRLAWSAAKDHPLLGIGIGNHIPYHQAVGSEVQVRVAHSVYFQILGEVGFVALLLYLLFIAFVLRSLWRLRQESLTNQALRSGAPWLHSLSHWMFCGFVGYCFGAALLNMLYIEFPWYFGIFAGLLRYFSRGFEQSHRPLIRPLARAATKS